MSYVAKAASGIIVDGTADSGLPAACESLFDPAAGAAAFCGVVGVRADDAAGGDRARPAAALPRPTGAFAGDVDAGERLRAEPVLRRRLHDDLILVEPAVDRRDAALAEGVVEHVVDRRWP